MQQISFRDVPKVLHPYDRAAEGLLSVNLSNYVIIDLIWTCNQSFGEWIQST